MNLLGVLGETSNTCPLERGAELICTWTGLVSDPVRYDEYGVHTPNVLFDFNGSGPHHSNNDPRYFLPIGSQGIVLNSINITSNAALLEDWCDLQGGLPLRLYKVGWRHESLLDKALAEVEALNLACGQGTFKLIVE